MANPKYRCKSSQRKAEVPLYSQKLENRYGHESVFCEKIKESVAMIEKNCTLVIAKHLSGELISVLAKARELDCRIIYDVTDNITDESYKGNNYRINIYLMKIILEFSDIIMDHK